MSKEYCHKARCLSCGHLDIVVHTKEEYQEVRVCPKCNGAFVDTWRINKYIDQQESNEIEIVMTDVNKPPKIKLNGKEIEGIMELDYKYVTKQGHYNPGYHNFTVKYCDKETQTVRTVSANKIWEE